MKANPTEVDKPKGEEESRKQTAARKGIPYRNLAAHFSLHKLQ